MPLEPETRLGPYRIRSLIGSGGMGEVYLAHDERLRRDVALKLMAPRVDQEALVVDRFIREALAVSALNHPNIVTIREAGEAPEGRCLVMEFVEGRTLRKPAQAGRARPSRPAATVGRSRSGHRVPRRRHRSGDGQRGLDEMAAGLERQEASRNALLRPYYLQLLADMLRRAGRIDAALAVLDTARTISRTTDQQMFAADWHLLRGHILKARGQSDDAQAAFDDALEVSRWQGAKLFEKRARAATAT